MRRKRIVKQIGCAVLAGALMVGKKGQIHTNTAEELCLWIGSFTDNSEGCGELGGHTQGCKW